MLKPYIYLSILASIFILTFPAVSQPESGIPVVNIMIDADMPENPTEEEALILESYLFDIFNEINNRNLNATVYATQDLTRTHARLRLTSIGLRENFELAMSGNHSDERLSAESLEKQKEIFENSKKYVEGCRVCGTNTITVYGYMPQSFDQNENTYEALDDIGIVYNAGFQSGLIFAPDHEESTWPYKLPNHDLYAVPVSSYELSGKRIPLIDSYAKEEGFDSSQWYDLMKAKFDDAKDGEEPIVIYINSNTSGYGEYLEALKQFLDYSVSKGGKFVTTMELVEMSNPEVSEKIAKLAAAEDSNTGTTSEAAIKEDSTSECPTCDSKKNASANKTLEFVINE